MSIGQRLKKKSVTIFACCHPSSNEKWHDCPELAISKPLTMRQLTTRLGKVCHKKPISSVYESAPPGGCDVSIVNCVISAWPWFIYFFQSLRLFCKWDQSSQWCSVWRRFYGCAELEIRDQNVATSWRDMTSWGLCVLRKNNISVVVLIKQTYYVSMWALRLIYAQCPKRIRLTATLRVS